MKQRLMLIGGGVITAHYRRGLEKSDTLELVALVDINPDCIARGTFNVPFYTDILAALETKPDVALLAVPASKRAEIADELLPRGIAVLCEKPMCASLESVEKLFKKADESGVHADCLFHWKWADEVIFLKNNLKNFGKTLSVKTVIHDDYAATKDGNIRADRLGLAGCWFDSGINVLSYLGELFDLKKAKLIDGNYIYDEKCGQPKYAKKLFDIDGVKAEIIIDWTKNTREKTSEFVCENGVLSVSHTAQTVSLNGKEIFARPTDDRLSCHYENAFLNFGFEKISRAHTLLLHKLLFTEDKYEEKL